MIRPKKILILFFTILLIFSFAASIPALEKEMTFNEYLKAANIYIRAHKHFQAIDALRKAIQLGGTRHPSLHMRLAILYYGLALIPEAIAEGEKAVELRPTSKWYKYDLGKFYLVDRQYEKAQEQFLNLLKLDPGFTFGYYYLAELFFQKKEYDMAWLSYHRAKLLGHRGKHLEEKLEPYTSKPQENLKYTAKNTLFRFITSPTRKQAREILAKIQNGKLFENIELELKKEQRSDFDFGTLMLSELKKSVAKSLIKSRPYSRPVIIQTGYEYRIMQKILPFDIKIWQTILNKTKSAGSKKHFSAKLAAFYALEHWKNVWESANIKEYFAAYSKNFHPDEGMSVKNWQNKRRKNLTLPIFIHIKIIDPVVEMVTKNQMLVTFQQNYQSDRRHNIVIKTLTMDKEATGWKIVHERIIRKIAQ